jgi:hypothetical protein
MKEGEMQLTHPMTWTLRNPGLDGAIVGFRRPDQAAQFLAAGVRRTSAEVEQIEEPDGRRRA